MLDALRILRQRLVNVGVIDSELASYAFFPLSHVFHGLKALPLPVLDLSLQCLRLLIVQGWTHSREAALCKQLLVLLSFIVDPTTPKGQPKPSYGDIAVETALQCLDALFDDARELVRCLCKEKDEQPLPVLGQAVSALLTTLKEADGFKSQAAASQALVHAVECLKDEAMLQNFFPGIVSSLTRFLQPKAGIRRPARAIVKAIDSLRAVLSACFKDLPVVPGEPSQKRKEQLAWRAEQTTQLQNALAQVLKLKDHEKEEVLSALLSFCSTLLIECRTDLSGVTQLLVDTSLALAASEAAVAKSAAALDRIFVEDALLDLLVKSLQGWLTALPRIAQSAEPERLDRHLAIVRTAYDLLERLRGVQTELGKMTLASLEQVVTVGFEETSATAKHPVEADQHGSPALTLSLAKVAGTSFQQFGHTRKGQGKILNTVQRSIDKLSCYDSFRCAVSARSMSLEASWTALSLLKSTSPTTMGLDQLINAAFSNVNSTSQLLEHLYGQSLEVLSESPLDVEFDWRKQSIALEVVALTARVQKHDFAAELIDVLFPVLERVGSMEIELREHALTCLNILAESCGASGAGDLVVQNADYLVNSVAQKLNVPDISPQTPRVLVLVIRLCGPSLIPYLDDTMTSIFEILDDYHGHYGLVDPLFAVLEAIVDQSCEPSSKLVEGPATKHIIQTTKRTRIEDVPSIIKELSKQRQDRDAEDLAARTRDRSSKPSEDAENESEESKDVEKEKPALSQSYKMVQSITRHCQHYLTHASPDLRRRLLSLVGTASSALSRSEDQYLPLINDIWPVVISRLHDEEPTVVLAAMETLSALFQCAGDFLLSRMRDAWPEVVKVGKGLKTQADVRNKGKGGRGAFSLTLQLVEGYVDMLSYLAESTGMSADMEDDIFEMLGPYHRLPSVHDLLQTISADALWLTEVRHDDKSFDALKDKLPTHSRFQFRQVVF